MSLHGQAEGSELGVVFTVNPLRVPMNEQGKLNWKKKKGEFF